MSNKIKFDLALHREQLIALIKHIGHDGHTIWAGEVLKDFPAEIQQRFLQEFKSDGSPKGSIFKDGKLIPSLKGIYGLDLLRAIANDLGVSYEPKMGRGFQASSITTALWQFIGIK